MDFARGRLGGGIPIQRSTDPPVEATLGQVIDEMRSVHPERDISVSIDVRRSVAVDHIRLAQMFSNLLGNAIAHGSADRPIEVTAKANENLFELSVANGGDPIPPAVMERLFQPFYRGDLSAGGRGLGLGLYIASQIAEAHGGRLEATSKAGETRFAFRMPLEGLRQQLLEQD
jgi:signal transduction histidine kinase